MSKSEYGKALKKGHKAYRLQLQKGAYPYLQALDDIVSFAGIVSETDLGAMEIPLADIIGTRTTGRQQAFACNFMPLLDDDTEFAQKWICLYEAHMNEGIRDPIKVVEFMNRYYVTEGNKRVSVLKYVGAVTISACVTRLVPPKDGSLENQIYYEFLDFYKTSGINSLTFSQKGCYGRLLSILGRQPEDIWTFEERQDFCSAFNHFQEIYERRGGQKLPITAGDAFLTYLEVCGYKGILDKSYWELDAEISAVWKDFELYPDRRRIELLTVPEQDTGERSIIQKILPSPAAPLRIAFIHDGAPEDSSWTYNHELGRHYLENVYPRQVTTTAYTASSCDQESSFEMIQKAVEDGCTVIFTTSPKLLNASVQAAVRYPSVRILNCSFNSWFGHLRTYYGRMYEAKFLTGMLAGILSPEKSIGYLADYPIYGSTASINAFALGVRTVNPDARIYLEWSCVKDCPVYDYFDARHIAYVSGQDLITPSSASREFGLYDIRGGSIQNVAMPVLHWGKFYERIVRNILNGVWKKSVLQHADKSVNYFWGLSSGMVDLICSNHVPADTRRLIELVKYSISSGQFHPFSGEIYSQDGTLRNAADSVMPEQQIGSIDWLLGNVCGGFPEYDTLTDEAKQIVRLQGIRQYQELQT